MIRIANAPVSYGVFELARPDLVALPEGEELARWISDAGYQGIDLGPVGLLGTGSALSERLDRHGLDLAGGWIDLPFAGDEERFAAALSGLDATLDVFVTAAERGQELAPLPTLADSGSPERKAHPGGAPELTLRGDDWSRFADRVNVAAARVRDRGLEPTFHHHACTYVETPEEVDALLATTEVDLTYDSGHLLIGGGDPLPDFRRWRDRVNHLHLKDARTAILHEALTADDPMRSVWEKRVFVPLGEGDLAVDALLDEIVASGYAGWLIVEQDVVPRSAEDVERAQADQVANREALRRWFA
ncbi:sugar phosphate isomerase/epimerase [Microbacterium sp. p3-SID336]|uniref:sugar phosphate isomerase/epimerase family protein n=1 Tax=Microbacterium sp. p3-SID336 TaxID=2916212 RepID=UPI0021A96A38|nr:sugar phosphate isomerase/epimerase [Microbacterium sp. p3-SID336]MCT1476874.1 sugar phosphate isomerase/epimerase [Microbacterium sp. p3-SID336]